MAERFGSAPRTELEAIIRQRRQTFEEFSEDTARYARENDEEGTLSARHLQRLASGNRADGKPLGAVRPATRRLLEHMLGQTIDVLLGPPTDAEPADEERHRAELAANIAAARSADRETVAAFQQRLDLARLLDRRLGAAHLVAELGAQIEQMEKLGRYSVDALTRGSLAVVIADACTLAGWQWLDRADPGRAWDYYARGLTAATESESTALRSYVTAGQSVVLLDLDDTAAALAMSEHARESARGRTPRILAAWLAAAHGEELAANRQHTESLRAFDDAEIMLSGAAAEEVPFLVFGDVHLTRWRGNALARLGDRRAVDTLARALDALPAGFNRAETALLADLADAHESAGDREAAQFHAIRAEQLARQIGSDRHRRRMDRFRRRTDISPPTAEDPEGRR